MRGTQNPKSGIPRNKYIKIDATGSLITSLTSKELKMRWTSSSLFAREWFGGFSMKELSSHNCCVSLCVRRLRTAWRRALQLRKIMKKILWCPKKCSWSSKPNKCGICSLPIRLSRSMKHPKTMLHNFYWICFQTSTLRCNTSSAVVSSKRAESLAVGEREVRAGWNFYDFCRGAPFFARDFVCGSIYQ